MRYVISWKNGDLTFYVGEYHSTLNVAEAKYFERPEEAQQFLQANWNYMRGHPVRLDTYIDGPF